MTKPSDYLAVIEARDNLRAMPPSDVRDSALSFANIWLAANKPKLFTPYIERTLQIGDA